MWTNNNKSRIKQIMCSAQSSCTCQSVRNISRQDYLRRLSRTVETFCDCTGWWRLRLCLQWIRKSTPRSPCSWATTLDSEQQHAQVRPNLPVFQHPLSPSASCPGLNLKPPWLSACPQWPNGRHRSFLPIWVPVEPKTKTKKRVSTVGPGYEPGPGTYWLCELKPNAYFLVCNRNNSILPCILMKSNYRVIVRILWLHDIPSKVLGIHLACKNTS